MERPLVSITGKLFRKEVESRVSEMIPRLYLIHKAWGCSTDVCDEVVQGAVISALAKYHQLREPQALETWRISILSNCHRMYWRARRCETGHEYFRLVDTNNPDSCLESERTISQVRQAISRLSEEHRKVLTLIDREGLSYGV